MYRTTNTITADKHGLRISVILAVVLSLCSCGVSKAPMQVEVRDSLVIKEVVNYRDSIIYTEIPTELSSAITSDRDTSHLETSIAISDAWVDSGKLHHYLRNKDDARLPKVVHIPYYVTTIDTYKYINNIQRVEVPKELSRWEILRMTLGDIMMILLSLLIIYKSVRRFLKI